MRHPVAALGVGLSIVALAGSLLAPAASLAQAPVAPLPVQPPPVAQPAFLGDGTTTTQAVTPDATTLAPGFSDVTVFTGFTEPSKVQFAADGRVFVAEKGGLIKVFSSLSATTPTIYADLRSEVDDYWDRGLLGFALSPNFLTDHTFYVQYAYDHNPVADLPRQPVPTPRPSGTTPARAAARPDHGRLHDPGAHLQVHASPRRRGPRSGPAQRDDARAGLVPAVPQPLQRRPVDRPGRPPLLDGRRGRQLRRPGLRPARRHDQPGRHAGQPLRRSARRPPARPQTIATAEGGSLRSQSIRRVEGMGAAVLNGALLRMDPSTGFGVSSNPYYTGDGNNNQSRILAFGLRNPFRFTFQPNKSTVWIGDVGDGTGKRSTSCPWRRRPATTTSAGRATRAPAHIPAGRPASTCARR